MGKLSEEDWPIVSHDDYESLLLEATTLVCQIENLLSGVTLSLKLKRLSEFKGL